MILPDENEQIYHDVAQFLKRINYVGFANFDMKYDSRDGYSNYLKLIYVKAVVASL